jgi:MOSC domain-containing protein YiiM
VEIEHLYMSSDHNYFGHHGRPAGEHPIVEVAAIECRAGQGIIGDRFFEYRDGYKGQITFFSAEVFEILCHTFAVEGKSPAVLRRNVITRGQKLNELIGAEFELQGVRLFGTEECRPCYWMDQAVAPGTEKFLRGNGGLRARILTDGTIHLSSKAALRM